LGGGVTQISFVFWSFIIGSNPFRSSKMIAWVHQYETKLFVCLHDVPFKTMEIPER